MVKLIHYFRKLEDRRMIRGGCDTTPGEIEAGNCCFMCKRRSKGKLNSDTELD